MRFPEDEKLPAQQFEATATRIIGGTGSGLPKGYMRVSPGDRLWIALAKMSARPTVEENIYFWLSAAWWKFRVWRMLRNRKGA